jgi:hypothetical protein
MGAWRLVARGTEEKAGAHERAGAESDQNEQKTMTKHFVGTHDPPRPSRLADVALTTLTEILEG